jgi:hypothetical protein
MALPHNTATAKLTIDGLAICCFNPTTHKWDLAFLHKDDSAAVPPCPHHLFLEVDTDPDPPISIPMLFTPPHLITFETVKGQTPDYAGTYPHGFFDNGPIPDRTRPPTTDAEKDNFRWVLDLENLPGVAPGTHKPKKPSVPPTRAFISDAVFYTTEHSPKDLYLLDDGVDPTGPAGPPAGSLLGRTNDEIAADIFCAPDGKVVINIDGFELACLPHRVNKPWQIKLTNLCPRQNGTGRKLEKGDFHLFFDALDGPKLAIWGEPVVQPPNKRATRSDIRTGRTDCDTTRLGTSANLDKLFEVVSDR